MTEKELDLKSLSEKALEDDDALKSLASLLSGGSRRQRQQVAAALARITKEQPKRMVPYITDLLDALNRPEAQTRWEVLDCLTELVPYDSRNCDKAIAGAEASLFDEDSGPVRLAAMRFLCKIGATTENRSEKVWPLIDEGIQCYHGDLEFQDMLVAVVDFSAGKISPSVKQALKDRMSFDAENAKGVLQKRAAQIIANLEK